VGRVGACTGEPGKDGPGAEPPWAAAQKKTLIATEQDAGARVAWQETVADIPAETLVFLDETSTQTVMTRRRARVPRGQRAWGQVPKSHGANVTCLAALTPTGIWEPCVFEGSRDGALFLRWVREWLLPAVPRGTTIVLDNLSVHWNADVRAAVEGAGCHLERRSNEVPKGRYQGG
jgi:hypothetical protein